MLFSLFQGIGILTCSCLISTNTVFGDGHAFTEGYLVGKHVGEFAGIPASGKDVRIPMCASYDVRMATLLNQLGVG